MSYRLLLLSLFHLYEVVPSCACGPGTEPPLSPGNAVAMALGHGCTIKDGNVFCFGENADGELGRGTTSPFEVTPAPVALEKPAAAISLGTGLSCALTIDGAVWCWGKNELRALANDDAQSSSTPVRIELPTAIKSISVGESFVLALAFDGRLFAWGQSREGVFARGGEPPGRDVPSPVQRAAPGLTFQAISAGQGHACGIDLENNLWCWGRNVHRQIGVDPTTEQFRTPQRIFDNVSQVSTGAFMTCAVRLGELICFGDDTNGERVDTHLNYPQPLVIPIGKPVVSTSGSRFHLCAVDVDNGLWCWGRNEEGQLGLGTTAFEREPRPVQGEVSAVSVGGFSTCFKSIAGSVSCMGKNEQGQLGIGTTTRQYSPVPQ
jgi:alpha-tubulin suppressor-like RCC1 family protein